MRRSVLKQRPEWFSLNRSHPLSRGLVFAGLGRVRGSGKYLDSSPYGKHGTLTGFATPAASWSRALGRAVLTHNGTNEYVFVSSPPIASGVLAHTVCGWFKVLTSATSASFSLGNSTDSTYVSSLVVETDQRARAWQRGVTTSANIYTGKNYILTGIWYHWALVVSGQASRSFYINGNIVGTPETTDIGATPVNRMAIGSLYRSSAELFANVVVADALISARCLSVSEIRQLADPSNVMLSGLILPPRRRVFASAGAAPAAFKPYWANRRSILLGGGV